MSNLTVKIDSVDVTEDLVFGSFKLNFKRNDFNTCGFTVQDTHLIPTNPATTFIVEVLLGEARIFYGTVNSSDLEFFSLDTHLCKVNAVDLNMMSMSYSTTSFDFSAGDHTEIAILQDIFNGWTPNPITTHVITGDLTPIKWTDASIRRMIDDLANAKGRYWYFDGDMELHWFASEAAPFGLSDTPNNTATFKYGSLKIKVDKDEIFNVTGGSLVCWQDGLRAGMSVTITNAHLSWAQSFVITEVEMSVLVNGSYEYRVSFGNQKPRITDYILRANKVVSTVDAGLVPTLPDDTTKYLRGDGSWAVGSGSTPKLDDCLAPDDNTDLNASTSKHGLLPKLPNDVSKLLSGLGTWIDTPQHGLDNNLRHSAPVDVTNFNASVAAHGFLPKLNGSSSYFLNGLGAWAIPAGGGSSFTIVQNNVTAARALGVTYGGQSVNKIIAVQAYGSTAYSLVAYCDASNPPSTVVATVSYPSGWASSTIYLVVPKYYYYRVSVMGGTGYLSTWFEWDLG